MSGRFDPSDAWFDLSRATGLGAFQSSYQQNPDEADQQQLSAATSNKRLRQLRRLVALLPKARPLTRRFVGNNSNSSNKH